MYLAQSLILAAEETVQEGSGIDLLIPAAEELIAGVLAFAIVFFVVWRWALPALGVALDARRDAVREQYAAAEAAKVEAEQLLNDYREQLAGARAEAEAILDEARRSAESVRQGLIDRAEAEAEQIRARAREEITSERARLSADLQRQVADLSLAVAEKVVAGSLDDDAQRRLVDRYIEELGGLN